MLDVDVFYLFQYRSRFEVMVDANHSSPFIHISNGSRSDVSSDRLTHVCRLTDWPGVVKRGEGRWSV